MLSDWHPRFQSLELRSYRLKGGDMVTSHPPGDIKETTTYS